MHNMYTHTHIFCTCTHVMHARMCAFTRTICVERLPLLLAGFLAIIQQIITRAPASLIPVTSELIVLVLPQ